MERFFFKYVFIAVFFLILGAETMVGASAHSVTVTNISENKGQIAVELHGSLITSDEVYSMARNTFSSIRQVETLKLGGGEQERDDVRFIRVTPRVSILSSTQEVVKNNFMHLLTERHCQGFYIYTLEKLII